MKATTPAAYLGSLPEPRRGPVKKLHDLIRATVPDLTPHIRAGMIGYGAYHYEYPSGRGGDWFVSGLADRKNYTSLYVTAVVDGRYLAESYRPKLPKADIGKSCIRFRQLEHLDPSVLRTLLRQARAASKREAGR